MKRSLPVGPALMAAAKGLPKAWVNAWGVLLLSAAVVAAPPFATALPSAARVWAAVPWLLVTGVVGLMLRGALYRLGVTASTAEARRLGLGLGGVQFGRPELRILGAGLLVALFVGLVLLGLGVVFVFGLTLTGVKDAADLAPAAVIAAATRGEGWAIALSVLAAASVWIIAQLGVRLSLFGAATVGRGRMVSLDALSLAQGVFWSLLVGLVAVMTPTLVFAAWRAGLIGGAPAALPAIGMLNGSRVYAVIRALGLTFVQAPLAIAFLSYAYNRLEYGIERQPGGT
jgi:hypothetical protein